MPEPGWYEDPRDATGERWFDGAAWTQTTRPRLEAMAPPAGQPTYNTPAAAPAPMRPCPYCAQPIPVSAIRCNHCAGELRYCATCQANVGTISRQKAMTLVFRKTLFLCMVCHRKLGESRVDA